MIAGHDFGPSGACGFGIRWVDIRNMGREDVNRPGIAHSGNLTDYEYREIEAKRGAEDAALAAAMEGVAR